jgi:flavodoxin
VKAVIIYNSLTGTTEKAAHRIASELKALRVDATPVPIDEADDATVAGVDLVVVGTWTDGIVVLGQKPAGKKKLRNLPSLAGKKAVVYCTYAVDPGKTLEKLVAEVQAKGADVIGGFALARHDLAADVTEFVDRLTPELVQA